MIEFRKRTSPLVWLAVVASALVLFLIWQFIAFQFALNRMPEGWTISGATVAGLTYEAAIRQVQDTLTQQPVRLRYRDQILLLPPAQVEVTFNPTATLESLVRARSATDNAQGFLTYIIRRAPPPQDIPAIMTLSDEKLRAYLAQVADQYDLHPQEPTPLLDGLRMAAGRPGYELDISASVPEVVAALMSASQRQATLKIKDVPPPPPKLTALEALLKASLRDFQGIAGVYVKNLATGEEYDLNGNVAFSGMGLLKIAIMLQVYYRHSTVPETDLKLIEQMMTDERGNGAANALLQRLGDNDAELGATRLTAVMKYLGLVNTFMATPYDQATTPVAVITLANSRLDISTIPDPRMQTTPRDIALLLEMIYDCSRGHGTLPVAFPNSFTPDECRQMLEIMGRNTLVDSSGAPAYLAGGLPPGTPVPHKHSWSDKAYADAAIVLTGQRDYVLVVFLYLPAGGDWLQVNPVFKDISRATYNFFTVNP